MPNWRRRVPDDHPVNSTFSDTDVKRTREDLDSIFDFSESPLERDDVDVHPGPKGAATVEPAGNLPEEEFEAFTESAKESPKLGWDSFAKENFARGDKLSTPRPLNVHLSRDQETAATDTNRKAKVTTDPAKYASAPERYDYPFVDTPSEFRDEFDSGIATFDRLESRAGPDEIFEY